LLRGSASRVGGSPTQRVFNLTLKQKVRSATATIAPRVASNWRSVRGGVILTSVNGRSRGNIALRVRDENALLESQRGIIQPHAEVPFAAAGNVIAYPDLSGEIDPLLSDAAGEVVTVAPVPQTPNPTLADFAENANDPNVTDSGRFRTLRPSVRSYDLNATYTAPLTSWMTSTTTVRLGRSTSQSLVGLASGLFLLGQNNPFSPFSVPVAIATAAVEPLRSRYRRDSGDAALTLTARMSDSWRAVFNGSYSEATEVTTTQRTDSFTAVPLGDTTNPFATDLGALIDISTDRARSHYRTTQTQLTLSGFMLHLPAGDVTTTIEGRLGWQSIHSDSSFADQERNIHRSEATARGVIEIPLASRRNGFLPQIGELSASAEYSRSHFSDAGDGYHSVLGLTWQPVEPLRLRGSIEAVKNPPAIELLGAPTIITPSVRIFDPLTGETVDVTFISGGNPGLKSQSTDTKRLSAILQLVPSLGLQLNGEYADTRDRNLVSALPPASEAVMLAFPDRFVRDENGVLTTVDVRPVNFARHVQKRFRYGFSLNATIGGQHANASPVETGESDSSPEGAGRAARAPPLRFQLTANHTIVIKDEIVIRPGLEAVDLLNGGAIGIAGGRVRHQLDATAALTSGGTGVRMGLTWIGASTLQSRLDGIDERLHFSPYATFNLRAFADARRFLPHSDWAKGLRLSLDIVNLTNERQRVRDSAGNTPLQYQPGYRDALGRTIELEIRKVF
jgi:hypothetical protein